MLLAKFVGHPQPRAGGHRDHVRRAAVGQPARRWLRHGNGSWTFGPSGFAEITLVQVIGLVEGMAFGMALLITAAAIVSYYVLPNAVERVVRDQLADATSDPGWT